MPPGPTPTKQLLLTSRGERWLQNFYEADRSLARDLASTLNLVSHNEFERGLTSLVLDVAQSINGPIALYGARELPESFQFESTADDEAGAIDATPPGADIGSEGRIASFIRNLCRAHPAKLLNHPTLGRLRKSRANLVLVVDDIIGSGKRTGEYLSALWQPASVKSWASYKKMRFVAVAYTATAGGIRHVEAHPCHPTTHLLRHCPTITSLHWKASRREAAILLCQDYSRVAKLKAAALGFRQTSGLLVFEHSCPNNVPAIFWAESRTNPDWTPLFPKNTVPSSLASVFPPEITRRDPVHVLLEAGRARLASALASGGHRPLTHTQALVLALFASGRHRTETVGAAIGLSAAEAAKEVEACIEAGWISGHMRITDAGLAEIRGMRDSLGRRLRATPDLGEDEYHPVALRGRANG